MEKPRELFETELAGIREELLRLGVRPRESLQQSSAVQKEELLETSRRSTSIDVLHEALSLSAPTECRAARRVSAMPNRHLRGAGFLVF